MPEFQNETIASKKPMFVFLKLQTITYVIFFNGFSVQLFQYKNPVALHKQFNK